MSNIEKMMENIFPIINVAGNVAGWLLICFSVLMLIFSLKKGLRKMFLELAVLSAGCANPMLIIPVMGKLMYMEPGVGEKLFSWKDMLLFGGGILILIIASNMKKDS